MTAFTSYSKRLDTSRPIWRVWFWRPLVKR
jgi:hypothetical protein